MTMRIAQVSSFFDSHCGGLEIVAARLAQGFAARGHHTVWLASDETPPPAPAPCLEAVGVPCRDFGARIGVPLPVPSLSALRTMDRVVAGSDVLVVHDCLYLPVIAANVCARRHGVPVLVVQHLGAVPYRNPLLRGAMRLANAAVARPMLAGADQVVFISASSAAHFKGVSFQRPPDLVFNGVDSTIFRFVEGTKIASRARFSLPDGPVALFVGRFVEKKGLAVLRAMAADAADLTFAFAGTGPIDPRGWNLPNVRVFEGLRGEGIAALCHAADAFVLPSIGEGYPLVVQEALACGLPVVCSQDIGDADPEAARHLTAVPPGKDGQTTAIHFLDALRKAIATDTPAAAGDRSAFATSRYSWGRMIDRLMAHMEGLVGTAPVVTARSEFAR